MTKSRARVLVVEDDQAWRTMMASVLTELGFEVLDVATGREAIRRMIDPDDLDLLVTNVLRPWPDGIVVAQHARTLNPGIPVLFVVKPAGRPRLMQMPGPYRLLPKPFTRQAFKAAVDAIRRDAGLSVQSGSE